jgi:membrane protein implicated in regulation of membrane protease activity
MTLSMLFLICFLVGLGVSAVSLLSSFLHLHAGGHHHLHLHFHHGGGGGGTSLLRNVGDFFGSLFNLAAITMFLAWFGGVGLLLEQMTHLANALIVILAGGAGMTGAASIVRLVQAMSRQEHPLQPLQLVGTVGKLTIPIREGGTGEVVYTVDGRRRCSGARADDRRAIPRDTEVVITRYDKGIAYVCEFDRMIAQ